MSHDRKTQSQASVSTRPGTVFLAEAVEDMRQEIRIDPFSRVADGEVSFPVLAFQKNFDSASVARELDRIRKQIPYDLLQARGVPLDPAGGWVLKDLELNGFGVDGLTYRVYCRIDYRDEFDRLHVEAQLA